MFRTQAPMPAIARTLPCLHNVREPETGNIVQHLAYNAEMQYVRKPPENRLILCNSLHDVLLEEPVLVTYHCGMRAYQHAQHVVTSNNSNCVGGFFYTDGNEA